MTVVGKQENLPSQNDKFDFTSSWATLQGRQMQPTVAAAAGLTMRLLQLGTESFCDVWIRSLVLFNFLGRM